VFAPLFARIAELSGKTYARHRAHGRTGLTEQEHTDVAFRVLADHARCVCLRDLRRHPAGQRGPQLRHPADPAAGALYGRKLGSRPGSSRSW
jgi:alanyl-tRNA synthetase